MCPTPEQPEPATEAATYTVPDMSCGHCKVAVGEAITAVSGVDAVAVDLDTKRVAVEGSGFSDSVVRAAVEEAGYEASRS